MFSPRSMLLKHYSQQTWLRGVEVLLTTQLLLIGLKIFPSNDSKYRSLIDPILVCRDSTLGKTNWEKSRATTLLPPLKNPLVKQRCCSEGNNMLFPLITPVQWHKRCEQGKRQATRIALHEGTFWNREWKTPYLRSLSKQWRFWWRAIKR